MLLGTRTGCLELEHASGVKLATTIESVRLFIERLLVKAHHGLLAMGVGA